MSENKNEQYHSTHGDQPKLVFDNVYGELEFYKKKCEVMEKDLFKSQTQVKKLEISLKKLQELNALNGKNNNNTSISFLLPSEFKTFWENFAKNLILEAFDSLYDDYYLLSYVTCDTLLIAYDQTKEYMNEKIVQVLKVLNVNINHKDKSSVNEMNKFFMKFKVIFQDYFSSIFVFTEEYNNNIKMKLMKEINSYSFIKDDKYLGKLEELQSDLSKKSFSNLTQSLFKMCIFMILHDPVLTFSIKNHTEREITYLFYNKNEMMNIEGFGGDQTPCAVIVPPPILRKNFSYLGIKPAVYCIQKSEVNEKILTECEKNKQQHPRSTSGDYSSLNNLNSSPKKLNSNKSASYGDIQSLQQTSTPIKGESFVNNYHSNTEKKKENQFTFASNKTKRTNSEDLREELKMITNANVVLTQEQDKILANQNEDKKKKCYDHPLAMKNKKPEEPEGSHFLGSFVNNPGMKINSPVMKPTYKSNTMNYKTKNSRSSSIGESHENSMDSKSLVNHLQLQNLNSNLTNLQNYTKTSRVFTNKNPLDTESNNMNPIPIRYIPTGNGSIHTNETAFNMIRSKNTKQVYVSDHNYKRERETTNSSLEEKVYDVNKINYPLKEAKDYLRSKKNSDHYHKIDLKYKDDPNTNQYFTGKQYSNLNVYDKSHGIKIEDPKKKQQLNNFVNYGGGYAESNNFTNLNRKISTPTPSELGSRSNNTSSIGRATSKEIKSETRMFASTPNELVEQKNDSFINYIDTNSNVKTNSFSTQTEIPVTIQENSYNDMKYNGPKKDNFAIRISKMNNKELESTPTNSKIRTNNDIKSQIGKYYNKVIGHGGNHHHHNSSGGNITNSPSSHNTYSDKSSKDLKDKKYSNNENFSLTQKLMGSSLSNNRPTNSYFHNFQQKMIKK